MFDTVVDKFHKKHNNPFVGLVISRHFFERLCQRFGGEISYLQNVVSICNSNLCEIIFDCYNSHDARKIIKHNDMVFVVKLVLGEEHPYVVITTCYRNLRKEIK